MCILRTPCQSKGMHDHKDSMLSMSSIMQTRMQGRTCQFMMHPLPMMQHDATSDSNTNKEVKRPWCCMKLHQCTKVQGIHHHLAEMVWNKLRKCCNELYNVIITSENFTLVICKGHVLRVREPYISINFHCSSQVTYTVTWSRVSLLQTMIFSPHLLRQRGFTHNQHTFYVSILLILPSCHYPSPIDPFLWHHMYG